MPRRCPQHQALLSLLVVLASFVCLSVGANTEPQTITSLTAYQELDPCAQDCFYFNAFVPGCTYGVEVHIGCSWACYTGAANDCFCRADKQSVATSFLSSCISAGCTVGDQQIDVSSGVGVYTGYCSSLGYGVVAGTTPSPSIVPLASTTTSVYVATTMYVTTTIYVHVGSSRRLGPDGGALYLLVRTSKLSCASFLASCMRYTFDVPWM
jgi:hypothetical protein